MKHEKFKLFVAPKGSLVVDSPEVELFLASGITPRSISISHPSWKEVLCIGYSEQETEEVYELHRHTYIPPENSPLEKYEKGLEEVARAMHDGIICQDVDYLDDGSIIITFLTHK